MEKDCGGSVVNVKTAEKNNKNLKAEVEEVNKRVNGRPIDKMIAKIREEVLGDVMVRVKKELIGVIGKVERLKNELVEVVW